MRVHSGFGLWLRQNREAAEMVMTGEREDDCAWVRVKVGASICLRVSLWSKGVKVLGRRRVGCGGDQRNRRGAWRPHRPSSFGGSRGKRLHQPTSTIDQIGGSPERGRGEGASLKSTRLLRGHGVRRRCSVRHAIAPRRAVNEATRSVSSRGRHCTVACALRPCEQRDSRVPGREWS